VLRRRTAFGAFAPTIVFVCSLASDYASAATAQPPSAQQPPTFVRPSARAVRIQPTEAPTIDGDLSDPAWAKAAIIDDFKQRSPTPYEPATERTVVRVMYDENNLYVGFYN